MYVNYNVNPKKKKTGDCVVRAVAVATGLGWDESFKLLTEAAFRLKTVPDETEAVHDVLMRLGFKEGKIRVPKGSKRPTVAQFAQMHPDWYAVLRVSHHLVATGRGNYVDIWDSGRCSVYKYWYKEINS
ncbi:MAG: hypothetical protein J6A59_09655 [Lachnospiraceae bacterium]|nr:hypothetical protein [Lachnospiraceae bacterium]